jgi:hypothetical protein
MGIGRMVAIALSVGLGLGMSRAAVAQQAGTDEPGARVVAAEGPEGAEAIEVTTDLLERVAAIYPVVVALTEEAEPRIEGAETEPVADAIRDQLEDRIVFFLSTVKLSLNEYLAVIRVLNHDSELREEFQELLEEVAGKATEEAARG